MKVWSNESSRRLQFGITGQVTLLYLQLCSVHQPDQTNNQQSNAMENLTSEQRKKMESWKGKYLMTSWENYADFLEKLGVPLLLRKLATMGTPIVEVTYDEETEVWNVCRTSTLFYQLIKLRSVDFKFKLDEEFDEITPDKRDVRSMVTVEGDTFKHVSRAKKEGVTGHTVVTEFKGDEVTRYMTIDKNPDVVGVMKFRRLVDGKGVEQMETSDIDFQNAETIASSLEQ